MTDEQVFDDGSDVVIVCDEDHDLPEGFVDHDELHATIPEMEAGEFLGKVIDPDNDDDNGSQWGTVDNPTMTSADFVELEGWTSEGPPA